MLDQQAEYRPSAPAGPAAARDDVEPIEKVLPEAALLHLLLEVLVGSTDDPDIDGQGSGTADPFETVLLQHPEQF